MDTVGARWIFFVKKEMKLFKNFSLKKISDGLAKTREKITTRIIESFTGSAVIDDKLLEDIEEILISSDIGMETSQKIISNFKKKILDEKVRDLESIVNTLGIVVEEILTRNSSLKSFTEKINAKKPFVILIVGVNGSGKTTTIGKLSNMLKEEGFKIIIGACDTFRAAAANQLLEWGRRSGVEVLINDKTTDPSSVAFETVSAAIKNNSDIVIIDTAGRLHTKQNLMDELTKINRVIAKVIPDAPHETILALDGNTGQNAMAQATEFLKAVPINGLIVTKLDGTAKGGMLIQISDRLQLPIYFIGVGEGIDDLQEFNPGTFAHSLFDSLEEKVSQ